MESTGQLLRLQLYYVWKCKEHFRNIICHSPFNLLYYSLLVFMISLRFLFKISFLLVSFLLILAIWHKTQTITKLIHYLYNRQIAFVSLTVEVVHWKKAWCPRLSSKGTVTKKSPLDRIGKQWLNAIIHSD